MNTRAQLIQAGTIKPAPQTIRAAKSNADAIAARRREAVCLTKTDRAMSVLRAAMQRGAA